jgi:hypothetical protein
LLFSLSAVVVVTPLTSVVVVVLSAVVNVDALSVITLLASEAVRDRALVSAEKVEEADSEAEVVTTEVDDGRHGPASTVINEASVANATTISLLGPIVR